MVFIGALPPGPRAREDHLPRAHPGAVPGVARLASTLYFFLLRRPNSSELLVVFRKSESMLCYRGWPTFCFRRKRSFIELADKFPAYVARSCGRREDRGDRGPPRTSEEMRTSLGTRSRHGMRQTLQGSFSAVSRRNSARKYAFESSRRDLHNAPLCISLKSYFSLDFKNIFSKI